MVQSTIKSNSSTRTQFQDTFSQEVWESTYKDHKDSNIDDTLTRVARFVASAETTPELTVKWLEQFNDMLEDFKTTSGGRIYSNAGTEWTGTTLMNCFTPDAQVLTSIGLKNICDVELGDEVLTHKGRFRPVVNVLRRPYDGVVQRMASNYFTKDIISTPEHPYYQGNNEWKNSEDVEFVVTPTNDQVSGKQSEQMIDVAEIVGGVIPLTNLEVDNLTVRTSTKYVGGNGAKGTKVSKKIRRHLIIDEDSGYLLGRFVGDGCTFTNNKNCLGDVDAFNIAFNTETEQEAIHAVVKMFDWFSGEGANGTGEHKCVPNVITSQNNTSYVRMASQIVATVLRELCGTGFDTKRIPEKIWTASQSVQQAFLRGLFDADGFVTSRGQLGLEMTNPSLMSEIQTLLTLVSVPATLSGKNKTRLSAGAGVTENFRASLSKIYEDDRLHFVNSKNPTTGPVKYAESFKIEPTITDEEYVGDVYNISVEEDESYVVNNVVVHNCFVSPRASHDIDSLSNILKNVHNQTQTLKSEGGWGENFSYIRPRGGFIHGIGVESPGSVKYMEAFDVTSDIITAGSGKTSKNKKAKGKIRKGAMMGVLDVWHPDIIEFITAKQQPGRLSKFNVSVNCSDEFMAAVLKVKELTTELTALELTLKNTTKAKDSNEYQALELKIENLRLDIATIDEWNLRFPDTQFDKYKSEWSGDMKLWEESNYPTIVYNTVSVTWLWNLVMESTYNRAEPGVLFLDRANHFAPLNYAETIYATNPCGEQMLAPGGVCNLGSLNLTQFVNADGTGFDLKRLAKYARILVRFLDNINTLSQAPLPEYEDSMKHKRRIGCGILGWGSALYMLKVKFGSEEASVLREAVMSTIAREAYMASIDLAVEKGMFKYCDPAKHADGVFIKSLDLPVEYMEKLRTTGIRNSSVLSIQPTGNTSIMANVVSGGLEPVFMHEYIRTVIVNTMPDELVGVTPKWFEGEWFETSEFKFAEEGDEQILKATINGVVYKIDKNRGLTREVLCEDYGVRHMKSIGQWDPEADWAATTTSLDVSAHVEDLKGFARWVDSAMSKTVNVPQDYGFESFKEIYTDAYSSGYVKGITTYRSGTMTTVLAAKDEKDLDDDYEEEVILEDIKMPQNAPATVKTLKADAKKWYLTTVLNEQQTRPVALFVHTNSHEAKVTTHDAVERLLTLAANKGIPQKWIDDTTTKINGANNVTKIARAISLNLRHGVLIRNIVAELDAVEDVFVGSFLFQIRKFLSTYIKDGEKAVGIACTECSSDNVIFQEGCHKCMSCGSSKCG